MNLFVIHLVLEENRETFSKKGKKKFMKKRAASDCCCLFLFSFSFLNWVDIAAWPLCYGCATARPGWVGFIYIFSVLPQTRVSSSCGSLFWFWLVILIVFFHFVAAVPSCCLTKEANHLVEEEKRRWNGCGRLRFSKKEKGEDKRKGKKKGRKVVAGINELGLPAFFFFFLISRKWEGLNSLVMQIFHKT